MNPELEQLAQRVASALFNGLYQGLLLAVVLWLSLKLFRGANAATRHAVGFLVLLFVAALPVLHFVIPFQSPRPMSDQNSVDVATSPLILGAGGVGESGSETAPWADEVSLPDAPVWGDSMGPLAAASVTASSGELELESVPSLAPQESLELTEAEAVIATPDLLPPSPATPIVGSVLPETRPSPFTLPSPRRWRAEIPGQASVIFMLVLGSVAGVRLLRLGWQWWVLLQLKRTATPPNAEVMATFTNLREELGITRSVTLLVAERISTPMAVGYFRSAVLLPAALVNEATGPGLEGILRHELAHIRRGDDWCNLLQQLIAAIHFYSPAVAWLSRRLTLDREIACDDIALASSASRRDYALLLAEFAGRNRNREWIVAPAAWSNRSQLKERINMILDPNRNTSRRLARTSAGALTVAALATAVVALVAGPRLVLAASADAASTPPLAGAAGGTLDSPSGDALFSHVDDASPVGATISTSADVDWIVDRDVSHAVDIGRGPGVAASPRPLINVVPRATITGPGTSETIVAQGLPPEPARPVEAHPPKAPKPGRAPKAVPAPGSMSPESSGESMEQRLERLERMIEQLVGGDRAFHFELHPGKEMELKGFEWHDRLPPPGDPFDLGAPSPGRHWPMSEAERKAVEESVKAAEQQMERAMKDAHREVARANEAVERTRRDAELRAQLEMKKEFGRTLKDADLQRKSLENQRRSIERQLENLELQREQLAQQIEKLDHQMERLEEQSEESAERKEPGEEKPALPRVKEKEKKY